MPKNVQTTVQPHSFHMLARLHSKSFKLDLQYVNQEHPDDITWVSKRNKRSNCQHSLDDGESKGIPGGEKSISASLTTGSF